MSNKLNNLPFDQYTRQSAVSDIINATRNEKEKFSILDVGGYKGATAQFQSKDKVTILDLYDVDEKNYIKGDGTSLGMDRDSFDFVVSFDALEHVPEPKRDNFISEMIRVAKYGVILTFPVKNEYNEAAELQLNNLYKKLHGKQHPWLKEHIEHTLPDLNKVMTILKRSKLHYQTLYSNRTDTWFALQSAMFMTSANMNHAGEAMQRLNKDFNKIYSSAEGGDEFYRAIVVAFKDSSRSKKFKTSYKHEAAASSQEPYDLLERVNEFYVDVFKHLKDEILHKQKELDEQLANNQKLLKNIDDISNSKSYKIARSMQKSSAAIINRRQK